MSDHGSFQLELLWATELVVTRAEEAISALADSSLRAPDEVVHRLQDRAREIAGSLAGTACGGVRIVRRRRETWNSESDLRLVRGSTRWQAVVILESTPEPSGGSSLFVHDPRVGVEWAEAPGSPYGRPLAVPLATGLMVVMPGWLEWSVRPMAPGSVCDVLLLDLDSARLSPRPATPCRSRTGT